MAGPVLPSQSTVPDLDLAGFMGSSGLPSGTHGFMIVSPSARRPAGPSDVPEHGMIRSCVNFPALSAGYLTRERIMSGAGGFGLAGWAVDVPEHGMAPWSRSWSTA
jgi:hypothetical protein